MLFFEVTSDIQLLTLYVLRYADASAGKARVSDAVLGGGAAIFYIPRAPKRALARQAPPSPPAKQASSGTNSRHNMYHKDHT